MIAGCFCATNWLSSVIPASEPGSSMINVIVDLDAGSSPA